MRLIDENITTIAADAGLDPYTFRKTVQCVEVQNVYDWIISEFGDIIPGPSEFTCVVPPWPTTWLEWNANDEKNASRMRYGAFVTVEETEDENLLNVRFYARIKNLKRFELILAGKIRFHSDGSLCSEPDEAGGKKLPFKISDMGPTMTRLIKEKMVDQRAIADGMNILSVGFNEFLSTVLMAFQFCHCKNVKAVREMADMKKRNQIRNRQGLPPLIRFHHIIIDPMKAVLKSEGKLGSEHVSLQRALHICRGHFRHYDETAKLFGKLTGTFWIPMHVRGTAKAGIIKHEYEVKALEVPHETNEANNS